MTYRIKIVGSAGTVLHGRGVLDELLAENGYVWLSRYDPEAEGGHGLVEGSLLEASALTFPDFATARAFSMQQPKNHPVRATDGRPNRPLTAFHLEFVPEAEAKAKS